MTDTTLKLIDLYELNTKYFNTNEKVQEEVNRLIEYRHFKDNVINSLHLN